LFCRERNFFTLQKPPQQKSAEEKQALDEGMKEMSDTFKEKCSDIYAKA
jgi:hypothetical protein